MTPVERITERVTRGGWPDADGARIPLLSIQEFFEDNQVVGSIGCNLEGPPSPSRFYELFKQIAARPDVKDIRVQITMFDDPDWPFSDTVFVMTTADPEEVLSWFPEELKPDEVEIGFRTDRYEPYDLPKGVQPIWCWWD
ncbi:MAG TPA: hypothetical protein VHU18_06515 [Rhizomicrobium sp.]|nr:hypothetical protein [Rhizomicrobium sp.]